VETLDALRGRIAETDEQLLRLVAQRMALVDAVDRAKRAASLPVRSYSTEAEVLRRFHRLGTELDLDDEVAERLAHLLIAESVRRQEELQATRSERARRILVVGGAGKMGRWLLQFFSRQGHDVTVFDPAGSVEDYTSAPALAPAVRAAEITIIATPLGPGRDVLAQILALEPASLVADIFSLKSHVLDLLRGAAGQGRRVASLHPLFGPSARTLSGRVMAVCDCGNAEAADAAAQLFADTALTITRLPVEAHDAHVQYVLGLSHLVAILFGTTLARSGLTFDQLRAMASTTFWKEARTAAEVLRENPYLYYEIQNLNRHSAELYALVRESLAAVEEAALAGEPEGFVQLMTRGREYFPEMLPAELG